MQQQSLLIDDPIIEKGLSSYVVLARKYRPTNFEDMVGQDTMIKTLKNAFKFDRVAHAFIMTGIRGTGKTSIARIIAKAFNCKGMSEAFSPCNECSSCVSISQGRNCDVIELDAASHTGVSDMREVIENAKYKPLELDYKVYIIDEVHMLSNSAFNALLKIVEEPPQSVKFIFATTEIQKVPITVLSRCQRFDLKRIDPRTMQEHLQKILEKEGFSAQEEALRLICIASDGSLRDSLSLLDQAIVLSESNVITEDLTRSMLGLASAQEIYVLFEHLTKKDVIGAFETIERLYENGAEPEIIIKDLLNVTNLVIKAKLYDKKPIGVSGPMWERGKALSGALCQVFLSRVWQVLIKGLQDIRTTFSNFQHLEMILIRISMLSAMPKIEDLIARCSSDNNGPPKLDDVQSTRQENAAQIEPETAKPEKEEIKTNAMHSIKDTKTLLGMLYDANEMMLYHKVRNDVEIIKIAQNTIEIAAPQDYNISSFKELLLKFLSNSTSCQWTITIGDKISCNSIAEKEELEQDAIQDKIKNSEIVKKMLDKFPQMSIVNISTS